MRRLDVAIAWLKQAEKALWKSEGWTSERRQEVQDLIVRYELLREVA